MDENAKICLYEQLKEMSEYNTYEKAPKILSLEQFLNLPDNLLLSYVFLYRDKFTKFDNEIGDMYYIELPTMDFSNQDLSMCFLHDFSLSTRNQNGDLIPSRINLLNSNANICITEIMPSEIKHDSKLVEQHIFDFNKVNFKGCNVYGFLPDEHNLNSDFGYKILVNRKRKWIRRAIFK